MANRLNLLWGVSPILEPTERTGDGMVRAAEQELLRRHAVVAGDVIGVVAGTQMASGSTNFMRLHVVGSRETEAGNPPPERRRVPRIKPPPQRRRR